jgi:phenylpyruvate tautomerase PptA (4-oxalocrotonate tautomerase family)
MKTLSFLCLSYVLLTAAPSHAQDAPAPPTPPPGHDHGPTTGGGRKAELVAGITEADFLRLGKEPKTVEITLVAVYNDENYGMNFNGYAKGGAEYTIPKGWTVNVTFINPSPVPHSVLVVDKEDVKKLQVADPYFKGAAVEKHLQGIAFGKANFSFVPDEAGSFAFACGFPAHTLNGHWVSLKIQDGDAKPTLKLGDAEAKDASPAK